MGRPRKSPEEKRIEGNRSRRPIPVEIFVPSGAPFVPEHLSDDAQGCAEHIIRNFPAKRLGAPDSYALAAFATAWAWHKAATHAMNAPDFKPIIEGSTGSPIQNPWFKILGQASSTMLQYASKLYLTPADRAALVVVGEEKPKSKFDGLRGQSGLSSTSSN